MKNHVPKQSVGDVEDTNVKNLTEPVGEGHDPPGAFAQQKHFADRRKSVMLLAEHPKTETVFGGRVVTLPYSKDSQSG